MDIGSLSMVMKSVKGTTISWHCGNEDDNGYREGNCYSDNSNDEECCSRP